MINWGYETSKTTEQTEMCDTSISIFKSISISRLPLFRLRDRYQYCKCLITISRPISILESCQFDLDTDIDPYFVKISRQYRYDIDISAFLAIPTSISISNQSVSHITGTYVQRKQESRFFFRKNSMSGHTCCFS